MENFDALIEERLPSGDLSGVIGNAQYVQGSPDQLPQGVNLTGVNDPSAPADINQYAGNVAAVPGGLVQQPGVTPGIVQQQPLGVQQPQAAQPDAHRVQELERIAYEANLARINAEEQAFQASIANLDDDTKEKMVLARELEQTREVNTWLNGRLQGVQQQHQETQQQFQQRAKNYWVMHVAHQSGLPIEEPAIRNALAGANDPNEMRAIAGRLVELINQSAAQSSQQVVNSGIFATGSGTSQPAAVAQPKKRSGDIAGLIGSRGQIAVQMG